MLNGIVDDWLQPLGASLDDFCDHMLGSWMFNYIAALTSIGIESVIVATARVDDPVRRVHRPTGATIWLLPAPPLSLWLTSTIDRLIRALRIPASSRTKARIQRALADLTVTPALRIARTVRREQCAAIVVQEYESTRFDLCTLIGRNLGIPVVGTFTGLFRQPVWHRPVRRLSLRYASGLVICAQSELDRVRADYRVPDAKLLKLFYPIDRSVWFPENQTTARLALGLRPDALIVAYHGTLDIQIKGLDVLLEAWERVTAQRSDPRLTLLIVGSGKDADVLARQIETRGRGDILLRREWIHDQAVLRRHLSASDVYAFPSRNDAFGIAVTEAMACGLPVVAARGRGIPDILPDGERSGGLVVPASDAGAFATALGRLLDDAALRLQVGRNALARVEDSAFDSSAVERLEQFLFSQNGR